MRYALITGLLLASSAAIASDGNDLLSVKAATAIVDAIGKGMDLSSTRLAKVLLPEELDELSGLAGCTGAMKGEITKNLVETEWSCPSAVASGAVQWAINSAVQMRFRDDGSLFAMAINPRRASFAATSLGLQRQDWPSRSKSAQQFAAAVVEGADPKLGGLVPLTSLQAKQFARLAGGKWEPIKYMSASARDTARKLYGKNMKFAQAPENAVDLLFRVQPDSGSSDRQVSVFFDKSNRIVGIEMETSLVAVAPLPGSR